MKKILLLILSLGVCIGVTGCGTSKEDMAKIENLNNQISSLLAEKEELLKEKTTLTDENTKLANENVRLESLVKAQQSESGKKTALSSEEKSAVKAIKALKNALKNPDSLQVHKMVYYVIEGALFIDIDATAENGFGGSNRTIFSAFFDSKLSPKWGKWDYDAEAGLDKSVFDTVWPSGKAIDAEKVMNSIE